MRQTPRVSPCLPLLPIFDTVEDGHHSKTDTYSQARSSVPPKIPLMNLLCES